MQNLKIRVSDESQAEEVKRLAVKAGYKLDALFSRKWSAEFCYLVLCENMAAGFANEIMADGDKPLSIGELRAMVSPMKEYLIPNRNYEYILTDAREGLELHAKDWIEIPEGAEALTKEIVGSEEMLLWWRDNFNKCIGHDNHLSNHEIDACNHLERNPKPVVLWQRDQDEPFLTPECTLNDQYAEIEQVRQVEIHGTVKAEPDLTPLFFGAKDNVNHPSHYTQGKVECIDALESATIGKSGIEAVCVANVIKYLWRYEEKNGLEDVKKAKFYLNRLLATLENNNG